MRRTLLLLALAPLAATAQPDRSVRSVLDRLASDDSATVAALWDDLVAAGEVPLVRGDTALFLWRPAPGEPAPAAVALAGDLNGWSPGASPLAPVGGVWVRQETLDPAARVDYKLVVDGDWRLDPANPLRQWGGAGPNAELRMPAWRPEPLAVRDPDVPAGVLGPPDTLHSAAYDGPVVVRVYEPAGAATRGPLPTLYVTDGGDYADDRLGALVTVLDNAIDAGLVTPLRAVFVDPRWGDANRRAEQYVQNPAFAAFLAEELVPWVEGRYATVPGRDGRAVLGTSLGGLFAAYVAAQHPDVFGRLAIQSPAFWVSEPNDWADWDGPSIYEAVAALPPGTLTVHLAAGTIRDTHEAARRMRDVLQERGHAVHYVEVPEGHSWGAWRTLLDDALVALFPPTDR